MKIVNKEGIIQKKDGKVVHCLILAIDYVDGFVTYKSAEDRFPGSEYLEEMQKITNGEAVLYDNDASYDLAPDEALALRALKEHFAITYLGMAGRRIQSKNYGMEDDGQVHGYTCRGEETEKTMRSPLLALLWLVGNLDAEFIVPFI